MTRQLFLSGRSNFARHGAVGHPADQSLPSVFDFETSEYQEAIEALAGASKNDQSYVQSKKDFKELVQEDLATRYPRPPAAESQDSPDRKYLLCGTFCTDGYQVKLQAYHLDHPKKNPSSSSSSSSSTSSSALPSTSASASSTSARSGYRRKAQYIQEALRTPDDVRSVLGDQHSRIAGSIDPGLHKPATFMVQDTLDPEHRLVIDIPRGDLTFNERLFRSRLNRARKRDQIHEVEQAIVGFRLDDPPAWCTAQPSPVQPPPAQPPPAQPSPAQPSPEQPSPEQPSPEHQPATAPEPTTAADSFDQEGSLDTPIITFATARTRFEDHARSILNSFAQLRNFYGSDEYKQWLYQKQQGTRAEHGKAVHSILKTLQDPTHAEHPYIKNKAAIRDRRPMLGIGDGNFAKIRSGADRSGKFRDLLVGEALGRGVPTYQLDEFRTSATCCVCGDTNKTQGRTVICQGETCGTRKDRDHNAVNNMSRAMVEWTREFAWPEHLKRNTTVKVTLPFPL
ncbi:hypothetical protein KVV02_007548 [Mortierella alpina]|uniref:Cas12f1-like TNB domain-containing protein n=1 Tax=Mortierella alpina TaxID=64518 RepID=A0A9P8A702_MORAP|nr:hypothetical protein KVV02_007548 [Mortierella alpina]